jgi:hypothetical protein
MTRQADPRARNAGELAAIELEVGKRGNLLRRQTAHERVVRLEHDVESPSECDKRQAVRAILRLCVATLRCVVRLERSEALVMEDREILRVRRTGPGRHANGRGSGASGAAF